MKTGIKFILRKNDSQTFARSGILRTDHGDVETPCFMPVGTRGAVKGLLPELLARAGTQMLLSNTYHLLLRPGPEVIAAVGGLHRFMGWNRPILTDSGGFQIYSLSDLVVVDDRGVRFRSHIDGQIIQLTPEDAVRFQALMGSDIAMVLDDVVPLPQDPARVREAAERTIRWAERSLKVMRPGQTVFGIVQGGLDLQLRRECLRQLSAMDFPGYALGGLSVGESPAEMYQVVRAIAPELPLDKPRYLMGVGRPVDLLEAIGAGIDLFDCVIPTRNGRNATAFTNYGKIRLRNSKYRADPRPIEEGCFCPACDGGKFSRAYIRHLFMTGELLGPVLVSLHNVFFYQKLMADCRRAIRQGAFNDFKEELTRRLEQWEQKEDFEAEDSPSGTLRPQS